MRDWSTDHDRSGKGVEGKMMNSVLSMLSFRNQEEKKEDMTENERP